MNMNMYLGYRKISIQCTKIT